MKKCVTLVLLVLCTALFLMPGTTRAEDETDEIVASGNCGAEGDGSNLTWQLDTNGVLRIRGEGKMKDYRAFSSFEDPVPPAPWHYGNRNYIKSVVIERGATSIGNYAFSHSGALADISIPDSVITIGEGILSYCNMLTSVTIPDSVTVIGAGAFSASRGITSISIPDSVTVIGDSAFQGCVSLIDITIPRGITSIGYNTFCNCESLTSITIPEGVTSIGDWAFNWCKSLTSITIPEGVESIGGYTFSSCDSMTRIDIPKSVTSIYPEAFIECSSLADVYYSGTRSQWNRIEINPYRNEALNTANIHCFEPTVSYNANGGSGTMESVILKTSDEYTFPVCGFTSPSGKEFKGWDMDGVEYAPGDICLVTADKVVVAIWKEVETAPPSTEEFLLIGVITGHKGVSYVSVSARLVGLDGKEYPVAVEGGDSLDGTDKKECVYYVSAPAGQYSLVVEATTDQGITVNRTAVVKLSGSGQKKNINLPNGQAKSKVNINKSGTKALIGGLDDLIMDSDGTVIGGASAEVTFTIDSVDSSVQEAIEIQGAASGQTLEFFEFSIQKTVDGTKSTITDTGDATMEIVLPFDHSEKNNVKVYRYHGSNVDILTEEESNGENIEMDNDSITIHAKKFSIYAVGYTVPGSAVKPPSVGKPGSGGTNSSNGYEPDSGIGTKPTFGEVPNTVDLKNKSTLKSPKTGENSVVIRKNL